ncbi:MAG TPA: hypothetical protein VF483_08830 [Gemmatimonadaceae bacterium]
MRSPQAFIVAGMAFASTAGAQQPARQNQADDYTRYELLAPGTAKFRILYEVTATTPGAQYFFNAIRKGSVASDESVRDVATGKPLEFGVVSGRVAREQGVRADTTGEYIRVKLLHPVPAEGETRILIDKTYFDTASYESRGDTIIFKRPLGIKRNSVVLPAGFELVSCNFPSQVLQEGDGRIKISFWNNTPGEAPLQLRARRANPALPAALPSDVRRRLDERAHQTREIVYYLQQPETHSFDLFHDYTESRAGVAEYRNVVRTGSTVSNPRGVVLDTGEPTKIDIERGDSVVVVFRFPAVKPGETTRLRMFETYTDTARYKLVGDQLVWDRSFGRPSNAVVLPAGWVLTNSSIPASVSEMPDGRIRLDFINPRPDEIGVLLTARRRGK